MHTWIASVSCVDVVAVELGGGRERRQPGSVADLVGEQAAEAGEDVLVAEEAVEPHRVVLQQPAERRLVDGVGLRAEAEEGRLLLGVASDAPRRPPCARCRLR